MFASRAITRLSTNAAYRSKPIQRRLLTTKEPVKEATANATKETSQVVSKTETVTWWCKLQARIALSSCEAELNPSLKGAIEGPDAQRLANDFGDDPSLEL